MKVRVAAPASPNARVGWVLLAASCLFHLPAWAFGRIPIEDDVRVFYFPLLVATSNALAQGTFPFWTPSVFGGYPLFADGEAGMLYPLHLLLLPFLAPETSLVALRIIHSALASLFTYALLRTLGAGRLGSVVAGLIYAYSGFAAGQIVHSNVFHSFTWLPLALALVERSCQTQRAVRYRYAVLAGAVFGIQALAAHVHITLLSALVVSLWVGYRAVGAVLGSPGLHRGRRLLGQMGGAVAQLAIVGGVGGGMSAAQLIPLVELGMQSYRGVGLGQELAATNSVWLGGLATFLAPALFDTNAGGFWGPWVKWETMLYVGLLPLVLAGIGLVAPGGRHRFAFGGGAALALLLTFGPDAPLPLWSWLHSVPGFGVLKSPGRFSLLLTLALAVLAAYGVDALVRQRRPRPLFAAAVMALGTVLVGTTAAALARASATFRASDPVTSMGAYLERPGVPEIVDGLAFTAPRAANIVADRLATSNPQMAWQLMLLFGVVFVIGAWLLGPRARLAASAATVVLVVVDLGFLWATFHPYASLATLRPAIPTPLLQATGDHGRVFTPPTTLDKVTPVEPNLLLTAGLQEAWGYSSIEPSRQIAYAAAAERTDNHLLDLWNVRFLVQRIVPQRLPSHALTSFLPERPLLSGRRGNPGGNATLLPEGGDAQAGAVHVVAALWGAETIENGTQVARIVLVGPDGRSTTLPLRAGRDVTDRTIAVPNRTTTLRHQAAEVAHQFQRSDPNGANWGEQLFFARLPLDPPLPVAQVRIEVVAPVGGLEVYGLGLYDTTTGEVTQVRQNAKYRLVHRDAQLRVYENTAVAPRVTFVQQAVVLPPGRDALSWMMNAAYDPERTVAIEGPLPAGRALADLGPGALAWPERLPGENSPTDPNVWNTVLPVAPRPLPDAARLVSYGNEHVRARVAASAPGFLVLADPYFPGWVARVDGNTVPILRANSLFRAVALPAGEHTVDFAFEPASVALGALVTFGTLLSVFAVVIFPALGRVAARRGAWRRPLAVPVSESRPLPS